MTGAQGVKGACRELNGKRAGKEKGRDDARFEKHSDEVRVRERKGGQPSLELLARP